MTGTINSAGTDNLSGALELAPGLLSRCVCGGGMWLCEKARLFYYSICFLFCSKLCVLKIIVGAISFQLALGIIYNI